MESKTTTAPFIVNRQEKSILVSREFNASLANVWRAYTESELLDQWWAPRPWRAKTITMNFTVGGHWLYAMVGPQNEKHWARMDFTAINHHKRFDVTVGFCDEEGNLNPAMPVSKGINVFTKTANGTLVEYTMVYSTDQDLQTVIEMGIEQGIFACMEQLHALLMENKK